MPMPGIAPPCMMGGKRQQAKATLVGSGASSAGGSSFSFSGISFGDADPERHLLLIANAWAASARTLTGATIGGNAASLISYPAAMTTPSGAIAAYRLKVPTGASGAIAFTVNSAANKACFSLWALTGLKDDGVPTDFIFSGSSPHSIALDCPKGGVAIGSRTNGGEFGAGAFTGLDALDTGLASREFPNAAAAHPITAAGILTYSSLYAISFK